MVNHRKLLYNVNSSPLINLETSQGKHSATRRGRLWKEGAGPPGANCPQVAVRRAQEAAPPEVEEDSRDQCECECACARGGAGAET